MLFPLAFSRALSVTPQIIIRKTYVKELLINDVIILPHTQQKKKLETLTDDKVT